MNMEKVSEVKELPDHYEYKELQKDKSEFQNLLKKAVSEENMEAQKYYRAKLENIESRISKAASGNPAFSKEISFGAKSSQEQFWLNEAKREYAKNGESYVYKKYMNKAADAHVENKVK